MKLLDWGYANYAAFPAVEKNAIVEQLKVKKGEEKEVQLIAADDLILLIEKGKNKNIQKKIIVNSNVSAPIQEGQKYGELIVVRDNKELGRVDLRRPPLNRQVKHKDYFDLLMIA